MGWNDTLIVEGRHCSDSPQWSPLTRAVMPSLGKHKQAQLVRGPPPSWLRLCSVQKPAACAPWASASPHLYREVVTDPCAVGSERVR